MRQRFSVSRVAQPHISAKSWRNIPPVRVTASFTRLTESSSEAWKNVHQNPIHVLAQIIVARIGAGDHLHAEQAIALQQLLTLAEIGLPDRRHRAA